MKNILNCHWCDCFLTDCPVYSNTSENDYNSCTSYCRHCIACDAHLPYETDNYFYFRKVINNKAYYLDLYFESNRTELACAIDYKIYIINVFNYIIQVQPENVIEKIKTILLFS